MTLDAAGRKSMEEAISELLREWTSDAGNIKQLFQVLKESISEKPNVELDFKSRPGVSYSLRGHIQNASEKEGTFFVMVDVIDDDPDSRWLSVCFYEEGITDPEEMGDMVPGGLFGMDGYCFDLYEYSDSDLAYLKERIQEAYTHNL